MPLPAAARRGVSSRSVASEKCDLNNARVNIVCARTTLQVILKKEYQDQRKMRNSRLVGGRAWYNLQAFRAVNQAVGRQEEQ